MKKLLLILFLLVSLNAYADFAPDYKEAVVVTTLKKVDGDFNINDTDSPGLSTLTPDLPKKWVNNDGINHIKMMLVYAGGINFYNTTINFKDHSDLKNAPCLVYIVYDRKLNKKVKAFEGYLGRGKGIKKTDKYLELVKPVTDEEGKTYVPDLWVFLTDDYDTTVVSKANYDDDSQDGDVE